MNTIIKKILKTFLISFTTFQLSYIVSLVISIMQKPEEVFTYIDVVGLLFLSIFAAQTAILYSFITTIVLFIFSLSDKRVLNSRFIIIFSIAIFIIAIFFNLYIFFFYFLV